MDYLEKIQLSIITRERNFSSHLNMEDITDADYPDAKSFSEDFKTKKLDQYHDMCVQGDALLLADTFKNFWNMCLNNMCFNSSPFSAPRFSWKVTLQNTKVKLDI